MVPVKRKISPAVRSTQYGSLQVDPSPLARRPEQQSGRVGLTCFLFGAFFVPLAFFLFLTSGTTPVSKPHRFFEALPRTHIHEQILVQQQTKLPVLFLHGLESGASDGDAMKTWLSELRPNQNFTSIPLYEFRDSLVNLSEQVDGIVSYLRGLHADPTYANGYHLIGHSQGGTLLRCVLQAMPDHRARSLISLAAPQLGVYGDGWLDVIKFPFIRMLYNLGTFHDFLYTNLMQDSPFGQFWHDPNPSHGFLQHNSFLPHWNGLLGEVKGHKENFLKVGKAYFFSGNITTSTFDDGIDPWNTGVWGFYDANNKMRPMEAQPEYLLNNFGLRSLDERGDLHVIAAAGVRHSQWIESKEVFIRHILPTLY